VFGHIPYSYRTETDEEVCIFPYIITHNFEETYAHIYPNMRFHINNPFRHHRQQVEVERPQPTRSQQYLKALQEQNESEDFHIAAQVMSQGSSSSYACRMNAFDLLEELIDYLQENAMRSPIIAEILDYSDLYMTPPAVVPPASHVAISKLPRARVYPYDKKNPQKECAKCNVCLERLVDGIALSRMPCGHVYHFECIVPWLSNSCTCPECRYEIETKDPMYEIGRRQRMRQRQTVQCHCKPGVSHNCFFQDTTAAEDKLSTCQPCSSHTLTSQSHTMVLRASAA
jgi:hypothetical protein